MNDILALNGLAPALQQAAEQARAQDPAHERLRKATRDVEAYFVGMLLKQMHESALKSGALEEGSEMGTYREMFDDAIAAQIGKRGAFGIADMLYKQLVVQLDGPKR